MGVYIRTNSKFYWLHLERPGQKAIKESSKIPHKAPTDFLRKQQRQQADEAYISRMRQLAATRYELPDATPTDAPTFATFADWYKVHHTAHKRGAVREGYILTNLRAHFGAMVLTDITAAAAQEYITARLAEKMAPGTVNREVDLLKAMLKAAVAAGHLKTSPLAGTKKLRTLKRRKKVLTAAEEARLLKELQPKDRALYIVAVDTLLRLSNVLNLKWAEVTPTHIHLTDSKTGPYQVPLSDRARAALATLRRRGVYVFPHRRNAKTDRDRRGALRLMLKRACKRAKIRFGRAGGGVTFHTATRATGATRMLRAGVDPRTVQAIGNWQDFRSMQTYLQTDDRLMREAVNTIASTPQEQPKRKALKFRAKRAC